MSSFMVGANTVDGPTANKYCSPSEITSLTFFCEKMSEGELVVLRHGRRAYGIAIVVGSYEWKNEYNHVELNGEEWDLGHTRQVCWEGDSGHLINMTPGTPIMGVLLL